MKGVLESKFNVEGFVRWLEGRLMDFHAFL